MGPPVVRLLLTCDRPRGAREEDLAWLRVQVAKVGADPAIGSGIVDNIPFTATMIPVVQELQAGNGGDDAQS